MDSNLLALHETYCLTFLVLCPECKKPVLRDKMEEHRQGGHQQVGRQIGGRRWRDRVLSAFHLMTASRSAPTPSPLCKVERIDNPAFPVLPPGLSWWLRRVKNLPAMQETWVPSLGWGDSKGMTTHSSILAWRIP